MAGHSKWSTIKRQKGANDAKRGAIFTKIGNQIAIAARAGTDPAMNSALALAIEKAKSANMPAANIQRAIDRVADKSAEQLAEVIYEGYGPGGVAVMVEAATDNKNRTYPEVRLIFSKNGGNIAEPGSVAFQFERKGVVIVESGSDSDSSLMTVLESGADDAVIEGEEIIVYTDMKKLHEVRHNCIESGLKVVSAELNFVPTSTIMVEDKEVERKLNNLLEALDDHADVTNVYSNAA